jgi:hypothetical protein
VVRGSPLLAVTHENQHEERMADEANNFKCNGQCLYAKKIFSE